MSTRPAASAAAARAAARMFVAEVSRDDPDLPGAGVRQLECDGTTTRGRTAPLRSRHRTRPEGSGPGCPAGSATGRGKSLLGSAAAQRLSFICSRMTPAGCRTVLLLALLRRTVLPRDIRLPSSCPAVQVTGCAPGNDQSGRICPSGQKQPLVVLGAWAQLSRCAATPAGRLGSGFVVQDELEINLQRRAGHRRPTGGPGHPVLRRRSGAAPRDGSARHVPHAAAAPLLAASVPPSGPQPHPENYQPGDARLPRA